MNTYADKKPMNKDQSVSNATPQNRSSGTSAFQFVNSRPEAAAQLKLQKIISNSRQVRQAAQLQAKVNYGFNHSYNGVIQCFGLLGGLALGALGVGAYGLYRWWNANREVEASSKGHEDQERYNGYFGLHDYNSDSDSDYAYDSDDDWDDTAEDRLERMRQRGEARRGRNRISVGRYQTPTGPTTLSGLFGQRMTQSRMEDYGNQTFGSVPPYSGLQANLPDNALPPLRDAQAEVPIGLSHRQRLAASLTHSLAHGSEEDRAPGTSAYFRAMVGNYIRTGGQVDHPLSRWSFPARSSAQEQRDLMEGRTPLDNHKRQALEEDSAPSSDEDDDHYISRQNL